MERLEERRGLTSTAELARRIVIVAMGLAILGVLVVLAQAASEVAADPSLTLEDGYWIGRLPWTSVGVGLLVIGSTVAVLAGIVWAFLIGGNVRRVLTLVVSLPTLVWWFIETLQLQGVSGGCMDGACFRPYIDPITNAYSLPEATIVQLLLPAAIVTVATLLDREGRWAG